MNIAAYGEFAAEMLPKADEIELAKRFLDRLAETIRFMAALVKGQITNREFQEYQQYHNVINA